METTVHYLKGEIHVRMQAEGPLECSIFDDFRDKQPEIKYIQPPAEHPELAGSFPGWPYLELVLAVTPPGGIPGGRDREKPAE